MPVRSLRSPLLTWPDRASVHAAVRAWAAGVGRECHEVARVGYFGSYARGDWGVGSDVDLVVIVDRTDARVERRALPFDATALPVPADVLVYTEQEWNDGSSRLGLIRTANREMVWVYDRPDVAA